MKTIHAFDGVILIVRGGTFVPQNGHLKEDGIIIDLVFF